MWLMILAGFTTQSCRDCSGMANHHHDHYHHQEQTPNWGNCCPDESTSCSPVLRSAPGGEKADVGWFQVCLNSASPRVCRSPSASIPAPWLAMNGSAQSPAVIKLWASPAT